ncbi:MAG TPA: hypothetical protein VKC60_12185, partial [Opitutaceae bacterium]|nr:hypothetical protein [Opitutaceae bacterium]
MLTSIVVVVSASYVDAQPEAKSETPFAALNPRAQSLLTASMHFSDGYYDARVALLWSPAPEDSAAGESRKHRVRESAWYALGLLVRDQPGDQKIALCIFNAILAEQIDAPGHAWDGTFYRWPEEPPVPPNAGMWTQFDPNWRQFIGCTFALAMETCG